MIRGADHDGGDGRLIFCLPSLPPSVNKLYTINHNQRRVFLSDDALLWRTRITPFIKPCRLGYECYKLTLLYESPNWLTKQGTMRKVDHCNLDKLVIDTLCLKWQWDDSRLTERTSRKEWGEREQIQVILERGHACGR